MDVIEAVRSSDSSDESDSSTDEMSRSFWSASALSSQNLVTSNQATQREQMEKGKALFALQFHMYAKVMRNKNSATCTFINSATTTTTYY